MPLKLRVASLAASPLCTGYIRSETHMPIQAVAAVLHTPWLYQCMKC